MDEQRDDLELIQYYIVNKDLEMSRGKTSAQVAHASMLIALRDHDKTEFQEWMRIAMKKVVLVAHEKDMLKLKELVKGTISIVDKGLSEIEPNSFTVLGFPVMTRLEARKYVQKFRLCK